MSIQDQIQSFIKSLPDPKCNDMQTLHELISEISPNNKLWFLDGKNAENKVVSNPNIGYGDQVLSYADGSTKPFYKIGISANTSGISMYILGIPDKNYLSSTYGAHIGKATVTGYCIKFKKLKDIDMSVLSAIIHDGFKAR